MAGAAQTRVPLRLTVLTAVFLLGSACTRGPIDASEEDGDQGAVAAPIGDGTTTDDLSITMLAPSATCDGADREMVEIGGATPGEPLIFSSPVPVEIPSAVADTEGRFRLPWHCDPGEARLRWEVTAEGHLSGRTGTFIINGEAAELETTIDQLVITIPNQSIVCDGIGTEIGNLAGAAANEQINFSAESSGIRPGTTNGDGTLTLNWKCGPNDVGRTWNVSAVGVQSGRQGQFTIVGVAPTPGEIEALQVSVLEDPFVCDGVSRDMARMSNFAPGEVVDFSSAEADSLIDGRADNDGQLVARWQCVPVDVGKVWQLTALGIESQRTVTITITGAAPSGSNAEPAITFSENPFACNGASRVFAVITNFAPGEFVDFSSPQADAIRQGVADADGVLPIRWQCGAGDVDAIWDVTATGVTSGRSIEFRITGAAPAE